MTFTLFWLDGTSQLVTGRTPEAAMRAAGLGAGSVQALDFYRKGDRRDAYTWDGKQWQVMESTAEAEK